jgi:hypothetical protein
MDQLPRPKRRSKLDARKPAGGGRHYGNAITDAVTPASASVFLAHAPRQLKTAEAWKRFEHELAQALAGLEEDEWLVLSLKERPRFVQFMNQGGAGARAETVSDFYLDEGAQLSEGERARLLRLGWSAPTNLPDAFGYQPDGSPNYFADLANPVPWDELAMLAVATLKAVHGAAHPNVLEYTTGSRNGASPRFPNLGIRRGR